MARFRACRDFLQRTCGCGYASINEPAQQQRHLPHLPRMKPMEGSTCTS
ncbi:hypothetical protein NDS46_15035 [Paenibacillus thiaminolyticus]|nr:hypothetical protein [Paenibacillus thiaminolyticus]WCF05710.1 hypothetical protein NDS46_15035 [Paenibacillus thiaminolyticus]